MPIQLPNFADIIARGPQPKLDLMQSMSDAYGPEKELAGIRLKEAQAKQAERGRQPRPSGITASLEWLEEQKRRTKGLPEDHPDVLFADRAEKQIMADQRGQNATTERSEKLTSTQEYRNANDVEKILMNVNQIQDTGQMYNRSGELIDLTPDQQTQAIMAQTRNLVNKNVPQPLQDQITAGTNFGTTLSSVDPEVVFRGSGGWGGLKRKINELAGVAGFEQSEEYRQIQEDMQSLSVAAEQFAKFAKTPAAQNVHAEVQKIINPTSWFKNPESARRQFERIRKIFNAEHANNIVAATDSSIFGYDFNKSPAASEDVNSFNNALDSRSDDSYEANLQHTADLYGISVEEVERLMGGSE